MEILQVKKYNSIIARKKEFLALERWKQKDNGYSYPVRSMFYFTLSDKQGYPTTERKQGYIAFKENKAVYGITPKEAIKRFTK